MQLFSNPTGCVNTDKNDPRGDERVFFRALANESRKKKGFEGIYTRAHRFGGE